MGSSDPQGYPQTGGMILIEPQSKIRSMTSNTRHVVLHITCLLECIIESYSNALTRMSVMKY